MAADGDLFTHIEAMKAFEQKNPNATEGQLRQIFLDSLSDNLRVYAKRHQRGPEIPSKDEMLRSLKDLFGNMHKSNSRSIDERLGALIQGPGEHPSEFVGRVLEVMQMWYASNPNMADAHFVERTALSALTTRTSESLKNEIRVEMNKWDSRQSVRIDPLSVLYSVTEFILGKHPLQPKKRKRGDKTDKKDDSKEAKVCRWGKKCFKEGCSYEHPDGRCDPQKKRKKDDSSVRCGFCQRDGHVEENCYTKKNRDPKERDRWNRDQKK